MVSVRAGAALKSGGRIQVQTLLDDQHRSDASFFIEWSEEVLNPSSGIGALENLISSCLSNYDEVSSP